MKTKFRKEQGYTLVEVMIALTILSVGILGTAKLQLSFIQSNAKARIMTVGSAKTQEKIEELMSLPYAHALLADSDLVGDPGFGTTGFGSIAAAADQTDVSDPRYSFYWNVADNTPATDLKTIDVIVVWNDEKNVQRRVNYTFVKSNR